LINIQAALINTLSLPSSEDEHPMKKAENHFSAFDDLIKTNEHPLNMNDSHDTPEKSFRQHELCSFIVVIR